VRHLSPGVAWHLRGFLNKKRPKWVLLEGPSDLDSMAHFITDSRCRLPIAALAYTTIVPVETLLYPIAEYSPEYQAILWARDHRAELRFIDLPASIFLGLEVERKKRILAAPEPEDESGEGSAEPEPAKATAPGNLPIDEDQVRFEAVRQELLNRSGEFDYESYWEGHFEVPSDPEHYRTAMAELGGALRGDNPGADMRAAETLVREAYMRRRIHEILAAGADPSEVVVIVGAYHAPVMSDEHPPMTDAELKRLPTAPSNFTLMPYSFQRLSSQSGYGAGNQAPAYFGLLWEALSAGRHAEFPSSYLSLIARDLRERGTFRSTAEVIEGARLAHSLAEMHDRRHPVLAELRDAAVTLLGQGEALAVADSLRAVEIGNAIGALPPGVGQTSIQDDFARELARLKLDKYRTATGGELALDLRENRRVNSEEAAFLDLNRSSFLHRLQLLSIPFAHKEAVRQDSTTWSEKWTLAWKPEAEIALVEAVLLGETVEVATAQVLQKRLDDARTVQDAAALVRVSCECALPSLMDRARLSLRNIAALSSRFDDLAFATRELATIHRYGDVRRFDAGPLVPLIEQLFRESIRQLLPSANCDAAAAKIFIQAMDGLNRVALEHSAIVNEKLWETTLSDLSDSDMHNPVLSGFACAILLERGLISDEKLSRELARRLSPGIDADLGAGWFEGLSKRNRYALLSRISLWRHLEEYVGALADNEFARALVFIRRSLESFNANERRQIAEILGEIWGVHGDVAAEAVEAELSESEAEELKELTEMDFGDL